MEKCPVEEKRSPLHLEASEMVIEPANTTTAVHPSINLIDTTNKVDSPSLSDVVRDISEISILTPRDDFKSDSELSTSGKISSKTKDNSLVFEASSLITPAQSSPSLQDNMTISNKPTDTTVDSPLHNSSKNSIVSDTSLDHSSPIPQTLDSRSTTPAPLPITSTHNETVFETALDEAKSLFTILEDNVYRRGARGSVTKEEYMPCQCKYNPETDDPSAACGADSDCINRILFIECTPGDCPCGSYCQNQRFQRKEYSSVDVVKTPQKGFGLLAAETLKSGQLVMEYIGEVVTYTNFVKRTRQYSDQGLSHFYFMSLKSDEVIDATQMGCLARFINHSCNPNCVLQKWIVGSKLRMGIFTLRSIAVGEELTFDYKFERYG
ncbi:hypothetical protein K7432_002586 [Basidiobolus ranarum]|uniref:Histone-lysine N-methyltransferase n=1 Tax=Basidiobolus ranarum TaxID=34480 RepID=A0ABR2W823_9FUNG